MAGLVILYMAIMLLVAGNSGCMHVYSLELAFPPVLSCSGLGCPEERKGDG